MGWFADRHGEHPYFHSIFAPILLSPTFVPTLRLAVATVLSSLFTLVGPRFFLDCFAAVFALLIQTIITVDTSVGTAINGAALVLGSIWVGTLGAGITCSIGLLAAPGAPRTVVLCVLGTVGLIPLSAVRMGPSPPSLNVQGLLGTIFYGLGVIEFQSVTSHSSLWHVYVAGTLAAVATSVASVLVAALLVLPHLASEKLPHLMAALIRDMGSAVSRKSMLLVPRAKTSGIGLPSRKAQNTGHLTLTEQLSGVVTLTPATSLQFEDCSHKAKHHTHILLTGATHLPHPHHLNASPAGAAAASDPVACLGSAPKSLNSRCRPAVGGLRQRLAGARALVPAASVEPVWVNWFCLGSCAFFPRRGRSVPMFRAALWQQLIAAASVFVSRIAFLESVMEDGRLLSGDAHSRIGEACQHVFALTSAAAAHAALQLEAHHCHHRSTTSPVTSIDWAAAKAALQNAFEREIWDYWTSVRGASKNKPMVVLGAHQQMSVMFLGSMASGLVTAIEALEAATRALEPPAQGSKPSRPRQQKGDKEVTIDAAADGDHSRQVHSSVEMLVVPTAAQPEVPQGAVALQGEGQMLAGASDPKASSSISSRQLTTASQLTPGTRSISKGTGGVLPLSPWVAREPEAMGSAGLQGPETQDQGCRSSSKGSSYVHRVAVHTVAAAARLLDVLLGWTGPLVTPFLWLEPWRHLRQITGVMVSSLSSRKTARQLLGERYVQAGFKYWVATSVALVVILVLDECLPFLRASRPVFGFVAAAVAMRERVESTMEKVAARITGTVLGAVVGFGIMSSYTLANHPGALLGLLAAACLFLGPLARGHVRQMVGLILWTLASVVLCQYKGCCGATEGSTLVFLSRIVSVGGGVLWTAALNRLLMPWSGPAYEIECMADVVKRSVALSRAAYELMYDAAEQVAKGEGAAGNEKGTEIAVNVDPQRLCAQGSVPLAPAPSAALSADNGLRTLVGGALARAAANLASLSTFRQAEYGRAAERRLLLDPNGISQAIGATLVRVEAQMAREGVPWQSGLLAVPQVARDMLSECFRLMDALGALQVAATRHIITASHQTQTTDNNDDDKPITNNAAQPTQPTQPTVTVGSSSRTVVAAVPGDTATAAAAAVLPSPVPAVSYSPSLLSIVLGAPRSSSDLQVTAHAAISTQPDAETQIDLQQQQCGQQQGQLGQGQWGTEAHPHRPNISTSSSTLQTVSPADRSRDLPGGRPGSGLASGPAPSGPSAQQGTDLMFKMFIQPLDGLIRRTEEGAEMLAALIAHHCRWPSELTRVELENQIQHMVELRTAVWAALVQARVKRIRTVRTFQRLDDLQQAFLNQLKQTDTQQAPIQEGGGGEEEEEDPGAQQLLAALEESLVEVSDGSLAVRNSDMAVQYLALLFALYKFNNRLTALARLVQKYKPPTTSTLLLPR